MFEPRGHIALSLCRDYTMLLTWSLVHNGCLLQATFLLYSDLLCNTTMQYLMIYEILIKKVYLCCVTPTWKKNPKFLFQGKWIRPKRNTWFSLFLAALGSCSIRGNIFFGPSQPLWTATIYVLFIRHVVYGLCEEGCEGIVGTSHVSPSPLQWGNFKISFRY